MKHKYYVVAVVWCPICYGTNKITGTDSHGDEWEDECPKCNHQGEVEVRVPLTEALAELGVTGFWKDERRVTW